MLEPIQPPVYLVVWDHKHGRDLSVHKTLDGARAQRLEWMKDALLEWNDDDWNDIPDSELHLHWPEISGYTEFFSIEGLELND
jgi:hypothetical protein|tara:strand:+ start:548 stop:796 length:249 start_codon:yes stop_codon:yes gene_type:complete